MGPQFARGILLCAGSLEAQYEGMEPAEVEATLEERSSNGHSPGMPVGAKVTAEHAITHAAQSQRGIEEALGRAAARQA